MTTAQGSEAKSSSLFARNTFFLRSLMQLTLLMSFDCDRAIVCGPTHTLRIPYVSHFTFTFSIELLIALDRFYIQRDIYVTCPLSWECNYREPVSLPSIIIHRCNIMCKLQTKQLYRLMALFSHLFFFSYDFLSLSILC